MRKIYKNIIIILSISFAFAFSFLFSSNSINKYHTNFVTLSSSTASISEINNHFGNDIVCFINYDENNYSHEIDVKVNKDSLVEGEDFLFENHYLTIYHESIKNENDIINIILKDESAHAEIVTLNTTETYLNLGETFQIVAKVLPMEAPQDVNFSSSDINIFEVSPSGLLKGIKCGDATLIVTSTDMGRVATCLVHVQEAPIYVEEVNFNVSTVDMNVGDVFSLLVYYKPNNVTNRTLYYESSDPGIAIIDQNGFLTGIKEGTVEIYGHALGALPGSDVKATCLVNVSSTYIPVTSVKFEKHKITSYVNSHTFVNYTVLPENATNKELLWTITNPSVAHMVDDSAISCDNVGETYVVGTSLDQSYFDILKLTVIEQGFAFDIVGEHNIDNNSNVVSFTTEEKISKKSVPVSWKVSPEYLGNIDESGNFTLSEIAKLHGGEATIIATSKIEDKYFASFNLEIASYDSLVDSYMSVGIIKGLEGSKPKNLVLPLSYYDDDIYVESFVKLTKIDNEGFKDFTTLEHIYLSTNINFVGKDAFIGCDNLAYNIQGYHYYLPSINNPTYLYSKTDFSGIESLTTIKLNNNTSVIQDYAFKGNSTLIKFVTPNFLKTFGNYSFANCENLQYINNERATYLKFVGDYCFFESSKITEFDYKNSYFNLNYIGDKAFFGCDLRQFALAPYLSYIGPASFGKNENLESFVKSSSISPYQIDQSAIYKLDDNGKKVLVAYPSASSENTFKVNDSYSSIAPYAFYAAKNLISLDLSEATSLTNISDYAFSETNIASLDFTYCSNLKQIGAYSFARCSSLVNVSFNADVNSHLLSIGDYAFIYGQFTSLNLPHNLKYIGTGAFKFSLLSFIDISYFIETIGAQAFQYSDLNEAHFMDCNCRFEVECHDLIDLFYPDENNFSYNAEALKETFNSYEWRKLSETSEGLSFVHHYDEDRKMELGYDVYYDPSSSTSLPKKVVIPTSYNGENVVGFYRTNQRGAFQDCTDLEEVYIPETIKTIEKYTFENCTSLKLVHYSSSVHFINSFAFANCSSLERINIGINVTSIDANAFLNCNSLNDVRFEDLTSTWTIYEGHSGGIEFKPSSNSYDNAKTIIKYSIYLFSKR